MNRFLRGFSYRLIGFFILISIGFSCSSKNKKPRRVYMPDMYYSKSYEPYASPIRPYDKTSNEVTLFKQGESTSLIPVAGTVARDKDGLIFYDLPNTQEGYDKSKLIKKAPIAIENKEDEHRSEGLYRIYCGVCHGENGDGEGILVKNEKILGVPSYKDRDITIGSIYHVIMYGRNMMGSYAGELNALDRWRVAHYIMQKFKNKEDKPKL